MLTAKRNRRKVRAMVLHAPVDRCLGVVQCALPGCEAHAALIEGAGSAGDQCDRFLDDHACVGRGTRKCLS